MKDRIKSVRKAAGLTQSKFGSAVGVSLSAVQKWELGLAVPSDSTLKYLAEKFAVSEEWLRTGAGTMRADVGREEELGRMIRSLLAERPDSFRVSLIKTLLRFDPAGPEWAALEAIFNSVAEQK